MWLYSPSASPDVWRPDDCEPRLWISSPVSVTIDSSTSIPYWAPLGESLERRVEVLEERTIRACRRWANCGDEQAIGVHLKWIALKKRAQLAPELVAAVRVPTPCTPR